MFLRLLLLLTIVPVVELAIILEVHRAIANNWGAGAGLAITFGSIFLSGLIGAALIRRQGLTALRTIRATLARGEFPADPLLDGALVLVGGTLLLTPGFVTDIVGYTMLIPWTQRLWRRALLRWVRRNVERKAADLRSRGARWAQEKFTAPERSIRVDITPREPTDRS